jgi:hypothetical protein
MHLLTISPLAPVVASLYLSPHNTTLRMLFLHILGAPLFLSIVVRELIVVAVVAGAVIAVVVVVVGGEAVAAGVPPFPLVYPLNRLQMHKPRLSLIIAQVVVLQVTIHPKQAPVAGSVIEKKKLLRVETSHLVTSARNAPRMCPERA